MVFPAQLSDWKHSCSNWQYHVQQGKRTFSDFGMLFVNVGKRTNNKSMKNIDDLKTELDRVRESESADDAASGMQDEMQKLTRKDWK